LPVGKYPMIFYPIYKLSKAGIKEILIITGREHMGDVIELLGSGRDFNLNTVGDTEFRKKCIKKIKKMRKSSAKLLFVSHDINAIMENCEKLIRLKRGMIISNNITGETIDSIN